MHRSRHKSCVASAGGGGGGGYLFFLNSKPILANPCFNLDHGHECMQVGGAGAGGVGCGVGADTHTHRVTQQHADEEQIVSFRLREEELRGSACNCQ